MIKKVKISLKQILIKYGFYSIHLIYDGGHLGNIFVHDVLILRYKSSLVTFSKINKLRLISVRYEFMPRKKMSADLEFIRGRNMVWSVYQPLAREIIRRYSLKNVELFQHGYFDFEDELRREVSDLKNELSSPYLSKFLVWDLATKQLLEKLAPEVLTENISFLPEVVERKIIDGVGFALRGPEFLESDLNIFKKIAIQERNRRVINLHLHPACGSYYKLKLIVNMLLLGKLVLLKKQKISKVTYSSSLSFLDVGRKMEIQVIYVTLDSIK
ncbi:hypothetical protein [Limnobacter sp.]|uniref:hypothetical protein n=1 Tax=Limnobacter sp. TaxID=2003368 RepID=UPI00311EE79E